MAVARGERNGLLSVKSVEVMVSVLCLLCSREDVGRDLHGGACVWR